MIPERWAMGGECKCTSCILSRWSKRNLKADKAGRPREPRPPVPDRRTKGNEPCPCRLCERNRQRSKRRRDKGDLPPRLVPGACREPGCCFYRVKVGPNHKHAMVAEL